MNCTKRLLATVSLLAGLASAQAQSISIADFRTESDLPYMGTAGPLVYEQLGVAVGTGVELGSSPIVSNPSEWGGGVVYLDLDPATNILTLTSQDAWNFQTFKATLTNISGATVDGITLLTNNLTTANSDGSPVTPIVSFTGDSLTVLYDIESAADPDSSFYFTGGTATFQVAVSEVPEPATYAMWLGGLTLVVAAVRRGRRTA